MRLISMLHWKDFIHKKTTLLTETDKHISLLIIIVIVLEMIKASH